MVVEKQILSYWNWLFVGTGISFDQWGALWQAIVVALVVMFLALVIGYLVAAVRNGPLVAGDMTYRVIAKGVSELLRVSPRRVFALARLAIQESLRRRVWVILVVFLLVLLFASWFIGTNYQDPARLYLDFVLTASTYLVVLMALFLSAFSLPTDVKNKTIHTIVTKPVRAGDILLGRILGFTLLGTVLLAIMGAASYLFVVRSLYHTHEVDVVGLEDMTDPDTGKVIRQGRTTYDQYHRHDVAIDDDKGENQTEATFNHWHVVSPDKSGGQTHYTVSGPHGFYRARVPHGGKLRFKDKLGNDAPRGISTGNEWRYRSFIEGGSQAAAIWTFGGDDPVTGDKHPITAKEYPDGLPLELIIRVFRSYKGNIEKGITGSIQVKNPHVDPDTGTQRASRPTIFVAKDAYIDSKLIPRKLTDTDGKPIDLFDDLVYDGKVEIWIQCLERAQYFGVAQADAYLRAADGNFEFNFLKGLIGIWVQMVLVISIGVMCSTFLSGPVAMLLTLSFITLGYFKSFFSQVALGTIEGGGPVEAGYRLLTQMNMVSPLPTGIGTTIIKSVDFVLRTMMEGIAKVIPNFRDLSSVNYVADGFNIPANLTAQHVTTCLAYAAGMFVVGYFFLRTREVAK